MEPVIGGRFFLACLLLIVGFGLSMLGGYFGPKRFAVGVALIGTGALCGAFGIAFYAAQIFPNALRWLV